VKQRTLKTSAQISGIGVHSGKTVQLMLHPAPENTGIVFRRIDVQPPVNIPAISKYVSDTRLNTCLAKDGAAVATVEHLLSAFAGIGIDNAYVDITAAEMPVMDGSAQPFVNLIRSAGIEKQQAEKKFLRIKRRVEIKDGDKFVSLEPFEGFKFSLTIDFDHPVIRASSQSATIDFTTASFADEISHARTFGFLADYEQLRKHNLGLGASLENTLVLDEQQVLNPEGLRYADEFVRHKILDAVGDLYLLGHNFIGAFTGYKSGHNLNHQLREAVLADSSAWEIVALGQPAASFV
jgi:UDP-3-O-[3-hydroxymyristoyl] N-acetylglucosamine deacetylase